MLQRIQTIYLFMASMAMLLLFFVPYWHSSSGAGLVVYNALRLKLTTAEGVLIYQNQADNIFLAGFTAFVCVSILVGFIVIFMYRNRVKQAFYCNLSILIQVIVGVSGYWVVYTLEQKLELDGASELLSEAGPGVLLPLLGLVFSWLARRSILKDEAKVRAMDRIR